MARKHRRRTRKRNKKGGFVGPEFSKKFGDGVRDWDEMRKKGQAGITNFAMGAQSSFEDVRSGYSDRVGQGGELPKTPQPPPQPPSSSPPMDPVKEKQFSLKSSYEQSPYEQSIETNQPTKEKQGGLFGLGWLGLGGRRLSHSSFINKMLRVRSKTKRNKAIRKYLKGGKKKTKKRKGRRKRKNKTKKRRRRR